MNAPDISINRNATAKGRDDAPIASGRGHGLDDVATLFPGMEVFHDLRISGDGDSALLCAVSNALNGQGARIVNLSLRGGGGEDGQTCIKCRLSGLTSKSANEMVGRLAQQGAISSARVEHVILRAG